MKKIYPVIFTAADSGVLVEVPDLEILTEGKNMPDAFDMARDAIGLKGISFLDRNIAIPEPSDLNEIDLEKSVFKEEGEAVVSYVDIDFLEYQRKNDNRSVRRNVTLPNWLNKEAEAAHLNVSKILQEALMSRLGVSK
ncbi:Uncharacterised protein family (UPF0150) [uncultured Roseburia sp.]|uniref:Type II toxin-antitoxin system HicB family antitoxin n=1 Tax=Brotonthovivens ammoniilytica TaxID=2981725 RepID=A0ABT2TJC3_9FIRM|nr:type II toxin-antitoxin system HicB family antitoxin [Brotonthovivens ammoniilytica]MCU6762313.1 type II toxin-antitoxin system HicB family antitoxin [Brotonthovivens ammoniilytica]SCI67597.1 Uncharacterised protein family (UPF0150) [uncultured Roseburia sp.]